MSETTTENRVHDDDAVEALLKRATPRPAPPTSEVEQVRQAVKAEWRTASGRHRSIRGFQRLAIAASVIAAALVGLNALQTAGVAPEKIATIDRQFGLVRVLGENARTGDAGSMTDIVAGDVLDTGDDAGAALTWSTGGSLRIDAGTRLEFLSASEIRLHRGRVYYDSAPVLTGRASGGEAPLVIDTDVGSLVHIGTRYMAASDRNGTTVSVREGAVQATSLSGRRARVDTREQLKVTLDGAFETTNIRPWGATWEWIERTTPVTTLDGRSVAEFLDWVSHETGLQLVFQSPAAEDRARSESLNGVLNVGPRQALDVWMLATDLNWQVDNNSGVIYVDTK